MASKQYPGGEEEGVYELTEDGEVAGGGRLRNWSGRV